MISDEFHLRSLRERKPGCVRVCDTQIVVLILISSFDIMALFFSSIPTFPEASWETVRLLQSEGDRVRWNERTDKMWER